MRNVTPGVSAEPRSIALSDLKSSPAIVQHRTLAASSSDGATQQTVEQMAAYITKASADPLIARCADYAWRRFGHSSPDPPMKCWAVFWWVKHCVKFRLDEGIMFQIGEVGQQDLLIDPAVLVRMDKPSEDCDGFTMLTGALLTALGVPVVIAVVAVDQNDPDRWSHVFLCALLPDGQVMPLDTSHGKHPGWMVPRDRISRWAAYDLNARPVDVQPSSYQGLHGYVRNPRRRGRGFGDDGTDDLSSYFSSIFTPTPTPTTSFDPTLIATDPTLSSAPMTPWGTAISNTGTDLTNFFTALVGDASAVAKVAETPTQVITLPNGTIVSGATAATATSLLNSSAASSILPLAGLALAAFLVISLVGKK